MHKPCHAVLLGLETAYSMVGSNPTKHEHMVPIVVWSRPGGLPCCSWPHGVKWISSGPGEYWGPGEGGQEGQQSYSEAADVLLCWWSGLTQTVIGEGIWNGVEMQRIWVFRAHLTLLRHQRREYLWRGYYGNGRKLKMTGGLLKDSGMVGNEKTEGGTSVCKHL